MREYRYLVFPYGKQPTTEEAAEFRNYSDILAGKYAIGYCRKARGLAIAFDAAAYEYGMRSHRGFQALMQKWEVRGGKVVERLAFVKDATALQPRHSNHWSPTEESATAVVSSYEKSLAKKKLAAQEAVARSLIRVQQTLQHHAMLRRFSLWVPYLLMVLFGFGTIFLGMKTYRHLQNSGMENRRKTTVRVIDDPMSESLERELLSEE